MKHKSRNQAMQTVHLTSLLSPSDDYARGYSDGFSDGVDTQDLNEPVVAWAIVDRKREKVRFETVKPQILGSNDVLVPLYVRPDCTKRLGEGAN